MLLPALLSETTLRSSHFLPSICEGARADHACSYALAGANTIQRQRSSAINYQVSIASIVSSSSSFPLPSSFHTNFKDETCQRQNHTQFPPNDFVMSLSSDSLPRLQPRLVREVGVPPLRCLLVSLSALSNFLGDHGSSLLPKDYEPIGSMEGVVLAVVKSEVVLTTGVLHGEACSGYHEELVGRLVPFSSGKERDGGFGRCF